jgi:CRISPR/Cas system type I-B associated protein Csh2 (Cas7 group RAMP superfamily)
MSIKYVSFADQVKKAIGEAQEKTLEGIGSFVEGEAITRSPVVSGNLKGSWNHRVSEDKQSVTIGSPVDYAIFVEKGTSNGQQAQNVLTGAAEDNLNKIKKLAQELMKL